jgi:uncharacterized protein (TIGR02284 family)
MESKNIALTDLLNSLIHINNDRAEGYEKAIGQLKGNHPSLSSLFGEMADESRDNASILKNKIENLKGEAETGTSLSGKIHRALMDVKWTFTGTGKDAILSSCIKGDSIAVKAYEEALASDAEMGAATRQFLISQKESISYALGRLEEEKNAEEFEPQL